MTIKFLFITDRAERKVRLCVKLFYFFRWWILICLTWNLSHFVPNSVDIPGWNFRKKTILGEFFRNFVQTKAILYRNLWNSGLISAILFWVRIALKNFTQVLSYVVCTQVRRHVHKKNHKKKLRGRKTRTFCFRKTSFVHSRSRTYYALLLGYFGLEFLPEIRHFVYWVLAEIWAPILSHKIGNKFLFIIARVERKVRLCLKLFDFFRVWKLIRFT